MARVLIPLFEDFEEVEAMTAVDVLRRGNVTVTTASIEADRDVKGAHGVVVRADALLADVAEGEYEAILLPGGPGTKRMLGSETLVKALARQHERGGCLAAICAAPTVLSELGLLEPDQEVTCYPTCAMDLDRDSAGVPCVESGNVITGQAPGAALIFALVVLKALAGEGVARKVARQMVTDVL